MYVFVHKLIVKILDSIYVGFWLTLCQLNKNGSLQYTTRNKEIRLKIGGSLFFVYISIDQSETSIQLPTLISLITV